MTNLQKILGLFAMISFFVNAKISPQLTPLTSSFSSLSHSDSSLITKFKNWVEQFKIEARDDHHLVHMFENWLSNDKYIFETNSKNLTYTLGHNAFSGMNSSEFSEYMGFKTNAKLLNKGFLRSDLNTPNTPNTVKILKQENITDIKSLPIEIDWRTKGVVSEIRNQLQCGSCWAFSGTSTLESAVAIKTGNLYDLSEQQSVSCAGLRYGNLGCNGGMYDGLWDYSKNNNGICSETDYPYTSGNGNTGSCIKDCTPITGTKTQSYVSVTPKSDSALMTALNVGQVSISIEADQKSFQFYNSGIYNDYEGCNSNSKTKGADSLPNIDHAVVLSGYGTENGHDYYILRNSWGTEWGDINGKTNGVSNAGYMLIARGSQYGPWGMCGLLNQPEYPVV